MRLQLVQATYWIDYIYTGDGQKKVAIIENMVNVVYILLETRNISKVTYF